MNQHTLVLAGSILIAVVMFFAEFGFAYDIYMSQENCQQMDATPNITANCWAFPSKFLVIGGLGLGLGGIGLLAVTARWYRRGWDTIVLTPVSCHQSSVD